MRTARFPDARDAVATARCQYYGEVYPATCIYIAPWVYLPPAGFPPIREIREFRENFEDFFQSGKSGKNRGFSDKIRENIFKSVNFFQNHFQTF